MQGKILIVDDDQSMCRMLEADLVRKGFTIRWTVSAEDAFKLFMSEVFDAVLTDLNLPQMGGIALCERMAANHPEIPVVVITAFGSMDAAVAALRAGAYDFVSKPVELDFLSFTLDRAVRHRALLGRIEFLSRAVEKTQKFENLIGESAAMQRVFDLMKRITDIDSSVLISGESGTGKELVARALHNRSHRHNRPFIAVNCSAVPESLLESELFGHVGGAFTDARKSRDGLFVQADGGTLLLDEIGDMPVTLQPKILRAIEERKVRPVGGDREISFDVRIVAATNQDLESKVENGRFREDLYYRLNVLEIDLPPLRGRENDVLLLAQNFLEHYSNAANKKITGISAPAAERLMEYSWPGNVRELRNCIERAVVLTSREKLVVEDFPEKIRAYKKKGFNLDSFNPAELVPMEETERRYIQYVLQALRGNKTKAARVLGFDRKTLYRKLEKYNIVTDDIED
jgi:DNA-binding NtrC family response regulator